MTVAEKTSNRYYNFMIRINALLEQLRRFASSGGSRQQIAVPDQRQISLRRTRLDICSTSTTRTKMEMMIIEAVS